VADGFQDRIDPSLAALQRVSSVANRIHASESRRFDGYLKVTATPPASTVAIPGVTRFI